jgi:hypothetical protein
MNVDECGQFLVQYTNQVWLVVSTPLKNISQLGLLFPIYGKIIHWVEISTVPKNIKDFQGFPLKNALSCAAHSASCPRIASLRRLCRDEMKGSTRTG